ncbi:MAG: cell envelope biogenesis protein LolA [Rhodobacterales bacterium 12-65-15]|nr:MAG: cell envelope biogenesis protein LolA [Rhodobacterales bacterium 12-65-15]
MMYRFAALAPFLISLAHPAQAEILSLETLSAYLNDITTVETDFTQINADGTISTGKIYIERPGRVRFEYAPPDRSLVIAAAQAVTIYDGKSNQAPETYPLRRTPLNLILADDIDLATANMVIGHVEDGPSTRVLAQDPEYPEYGSIELVFTADPVELRQWVIIDDLGTATTVILGEMIKGEELEPGLFDTTLEAERRAN